MNAKTSGLRSGFVAILSALLLSCSGSSEEQDSGPPGRDGGAELRDGGTSARDAGATTRDGGSETRDAGADGDGDFATARSVMVNAPNDTRAVIEVPNDVDFYRVEVEAGQYLRVLANSSTIQGVRTDPVIELYDEAEVLLATDYRGFPRFSGESELIHRIAISGTYFVKIQEWSSWSPDSTEALGGPAYRYALQIRTLNDSNPDTTIDDETGDDVASAKPMRSGTIVGTFENESDVDVYWISGNPSWEYLMLRAHPSGPAGNGSTTTGGLMRVTTVDGSTVTAQADLFAEYRYAVPQYQEPGVLVWISHPGGAIGTNDFYVLTVFGWDVPKEVLPDTNDDAASADALALEGSATFRYAQVHGELPQADVDYFRFEVFANERLTAECLGRAWGSGLDGLTIELLDNNEVVIASAVESSPDGVALVDVDVPSPGAYFLRLSKVGQAADNPSSFYECFVYASATP